MGDNNLRNTWAMRVIFFSKSSKFNAESKKAIKYTEQVFSFWENLIWTGSAKLSVLLREYS